MFIDATVKSGRASDRQSRILAADARKSIYGEVVRVPRAWRDKRQVVIELAQQGHEYDDWLDSWVPPATNQFIVEVMQ